MISPEILRRYPFFSGLDQEHLVILANCAKEANVEKDSYFFHENDEIHEFYLLLEGAVGIVVELPLRGSEHAVSDQFARTMSTEAVVTSVAGPGDIFAWSGLVPPFVTMAGAKALAPCRVVVFDCKALAEAFAEDCQFGFLMMQKIAQVVRQRLRDQRLESLAQVII